MKSAIIFEQTVTKLDLSSNEIGDLGAEYLASALLKNTVNT